MHSRTCSNNDTRLGKHLAKPETVVGSGRNNVEKNILYEF